MWAIDGLDRMQHFEERKEVYAIYIDNLMQHSISDSIAKMQRGFNHRAGPNFHILFPTNSKQFTVDFKADVEDYSLEIADEFCRRFDVPDDSLPMLFFPCLRDDSYYLTIQLNNDRCPDAINRISEITREVLRHKPPEDMTGDEFRKMVTDYIKGNDNSKAIDRALLACGAFAFTSYAPDALQWIFHQYLF